MIKSMTGFGRGEYSDGKRNIIAEVKTVNHRYSDISVRMPRRYSFAEEKIKGVIKDKISRGKIDVSILIENLTEEEVAIKLNVPVAEQYFKSMKLLKEELDVTGEISAQFIATMPDVIKSIPNIQDEQELIESILKPVEEAVCNLDKMRSTEGLKLAEDIAMRGDLIESKVEKIEKIAPEVVENYTKRLRERITELIGNAVTAQEDRILMEAAIFADKSNITEEIVRLKSHIKQLRDILSNGNGGDGKKIDFLVQEMNREANTIGSKANYLDITNTVIDIKSEIEKIREQVQNIE